MPTPPKTFEVLKGEGKSHRTKAELSQRKEGEEALITGEHMQVWPSLDKAAKTEFNRVKDLLAKINKDDALYEGSVNRYAQLKSECAKFEKAIKKQYRNMSEIAKQYRDGKIDFLTYMDLTQKAASNITSLDKQIHTKRKMLLDLEKENIMTIASALRSIPKKVNSKPASSGMGAFMAQRNGGGG